MLMVIFGAGASHGSAPAQSNASLNEPRRPPVTAELFASRYGDIADKYPASRPAIVRMQRSLAEDPQTLIETEIGKLAEESAGNPEQSRHLLGLRFYLNDLIDSRTGEWWQRLHGFTFYGQLLERLGRWRHHTGQEIALVTFNYDELLDSSLNGQIGSPYFGSFNSFIERNDWRLYKLHGSTGWSRALRVNLGRPLDIPSVTDIIAAGESLNFEEGELRPRPWATALGDREDPATMLIAPGIAVPTDRKQTFSCPSEHVTRFAEDAQKTDRMLVIGWRGSEPHALEVLSSNMSSVRQLAVADVTKKSSSSVLRNLRNGGIQPLFPAPLEGGFQGLLAGDFLEKWLAS